MESLLKLIKNNFQGNVSLYPRREGIFQLILPVFHEDGDMVDVYLTNSQGGNGKTRILDCGMTLMKLSYTYDLNSPSREQIFNRHYIDFRA